MPVPRVRFVENGDKHRWNILQEIFRFDTIEESRVLTEFVRHLVNDEVAAGRERIVSFLQERPLLFDLEDAERDAGKDVIAMGDAVARQFVGQVRSISIDDVHAPIVRELPAQVVRESAVQFKKKELRIWRHASRDLARVHAFTRTVFGDNAWSSEIHFLGDPLHERSRAGNNGGNLKWPLQESLEKEGAH